MSQPDRKVTEAACVDYQGPDASVECAYPSCTNRLRRSDFDGPQWCSKAHREASQQAATNPPRKCNRVQCDKPYGHAEPCSDSSAASVIDCAHYVESVEEDELGYYAPLCACGWKCYPCPDLETATDALMQHAYEAGYALALQNAVAIQQGKLA